MVLCYNDKKWREKNMWQEYYKAYIAKYEHWVFIAEFFKSTKYRIGIFQYNKLIFKAVITREYNMHNLYNDLVTICIKRQLLLDNIRKFFFLDKKSGLRKLIYQLSSQQEIRIRLNNTPVPINLAKRTSLKRHLDKLHVLFSVVPLSGTARVKYHQLMIPYEYFVVFKEKVFIDKCINEYVTNMGL